MPRYNKIEDKLYRSCVEFEYFDSNGSLQNEVWRSDGYPKINTARGMRTRQIDSLKRYGYYASGGNSVTIIGKWDEFVDLDWKRL